MASTPQKKQTKQPSKRKKIGPPKLTKVNVNEGDLLMVTWMDACATVGWEDHRADNLKPAHCRSVGWLGKSDEGYLVLYADRAHDNMEDHDSNRRLVIPSGWITGIKKVKA